MSLLQKQAWRTRDCNGTGQWTAVLQASLSFTISLSLHKFMSTESVMPSSHLILCCPLLLLPSIFSITRFFVVVFFSMSWLLASGSPSTGTSESVLPMNVQGWFPLGLTGLICLLFKGLSRVFSSTTIRQHQILGALPPLWSNSHFCTWLLVKS